MTTAFTPESMPLLAELFRLFLSGKHLNRIAEPALWAELEKQEEVYRSLFAALGYELRLDARGFAWFHAPQANSLIGKTSRQLALLFMVIFDAQANLGKPLLRFGDWRIDRDWLDEVHKQQHEVLDAEGISPDGLVDLINRAASLGFALSEPNGWRLLPAQSVSKRVNKSLPPTRISANQIMIGEMAAGIAQETTKRPPQAFIASISAAVPVIFITRFRL